MALTCEGVPDICPVDVLKVNPVGKLGLMASVTVPNPPLTATGVNGVTAVFWVSVLVAMACVVISAGSASTVSEKVLDPICTGDPESATVTV